MFWKWSNIGHFPTFIKQGVRSDLINKRTIGAIPYKGNPFSFSLNGLISIEFYRFPLTFRTGFSHESTQSLERNHPL